MVGLNLHNIAGNVLAFVNPWKEMTFTKKVVTWEKGKREPSFVTSTVTVQGKLQPADLQTLISLGYNPREYQYWRVYLSIDATQLDKIRQLGSDVFVCEGLKYRLTDKMDWYQDGFREAYCYLDNEVEDEGK